MKFLSLSFTALAIFASGITAHPTAYPDKFVTRHPAHPKENGLGIRAPDERCGFEACHKGKPCVNREYCHCHTGECAPKEDL
ncbi:hypothetical protein ABVK25_004597 [Lepraria finkii]|uniref:Uncharacterized protein n=1 Tax=Lepraria finkii TaxID=1340010 RepID=A0ABR4BBN1_9LECA